MIFSISSSLSAIKSYAEKMRVISNNVANVETDKFKKRRAILVEDPESNVHAEINHIETPGPTVTEVNEGHISQRELSNVNLAEEIPQTISTQRGYEANLLTINTQDEMLRSIIDILA